MFFTGNIKADKKHILLWLAFLAVLCGVIVLLRCDIRVKADWVSLYFNPSAERAYTYGTSRFDARDPRQYDRETAEKFLKKAAELDSEFPYVQHQLARIAFLRGDYVWALHHINNEINRYGAEHANSYYVRALIYGFMGEFRKAAKDYETYLRTDPTNWAAINDYAWVLLRSGQAEESFIATAYGLEFHPSNVWLLNSHAIALFELGRPAEALPYIEKAEQLLATVTEHDWLTAYPGNNPRDAGLGMEALHKSVRDNLRKLEAKTEDVE